MACAADSMPSYRNQRRYQFAKVLKQEIPFDELSVTTNAKRLQCNGDAEIPQNRSKPRSSHSSHSNF